MTSAAAKKNEYARIRLPKSRMKEILAGILKDQRLVAPVKEASNTVFKQVDSVDAIAFGDDAAYKSPKEFVFPQMEKLMIFKKDGELESCHEAPETVIFGVRPCDLEALKIMTAIFTKGKYADSYFIQKLENTILIGLGCISEKPGCFCAERGVDKGLSHDCDIFLQDSGNDYIANVLTEKGRALLEKYGLELSGNEACDCTENEECKLLELNSDENTLFSKVDWGLISEKCMACGTCTFVCPTCHCFAFKDVSSGGEAERYRCWDSCMNPGFTLHASGHNPRASKKERYRQRILHKYLYVKENFGYTACTGCGRCIRSCPAGMDIKSVVAGIMEALK